MKGPYFRADLEEMSLGAYLTPLVNARRSLALRVRAPWASGAVYLYEGNLHHAEVSSPRHLEGYRALDYLLGLRQGRVEAEETPLGRTPTLSGDFLTLRFITERSGVWERASALPPDWSLRLRLTPKGRGVLRRHGPRLLPLLEKGEGKPLAEALALYPALPSGAAFALAALVRMGFLTLEAPRRPLFSLPWPRRT